MHFTSPFTLLAIAGVVSAGPIVKRTSPGVGESSAAPAPSFELPGSPLGTGLVNWSGLPSGCAGLADIIGACQTPGDARCGCTAELEEALVKCTQCMGADPSIPIPKVVSGFIMTTFEAVCHPDKALATYEAAKSSSSSSHGSTTSGTTSSSGSGSVVVEDPVNNAAPVPVAQASSSVALFEPIPTGAATTASPTPVGAVVDNGSSTPSSSVEVPAAASSAPVAESSAAPPAAESVPLAAESSVAAPVPAESVPAPEAPAPAAEQPAPVVPTPGVSGPDYQLDRQPDTAAPVIPASVNNAVAAAAVGADVPPPVTTSGVSGAEYQLDRQPEEGAALALSTRSGMMGAFVGVAGVVGMLL